MPGPVPYFDWAACGTSAQYQKHLRHKIPACQPCLKAERRRCQDRSHGWLWQFNHMVQQVNTDLRRRQACRRGVA